MNATKKVLLVGAGALGQVFGAHLTRGGVQVHVLVKPNSEQAARRVFHLWRLRRGRPPLKMPFHPSSVITDPAAAGELACDAALLCVPSDALHERWLPRLISTIGPATIVSIGQAARDYELLASLLPAGQAIFLVPALFAWKEPLPREPPIPAVTYWLPPGAKQAVSGESDRTIPFAAALGAGGLSVGSTPHTAIDGAKMAARTIPYAVALEAAGWSFRALRTNPLLEVAAAAAREAETAVESHYHDARAPKMRLPAPRLARLALRLLPAVAPFDTEAYARAHFEKVREQTDMMLTEWIELARKHDLASDALAELKRARRGGHTSA